MALELLHVTQIRGDTAEVMPAPKIYKVGVLNYTRLPQSD